MSNLKELMNAGRPAELPPYKGMKTGTPEATILMLPNLKDSRPVLAVDKHGDFRVCIWSEWSNLIDREFYNQKGFWSMHISENRINDIIGWFDLPERLG